MRRSFHSNLRLILQFLAWWLMTRFGPFKQTLRHYRNQNVWLDHAPHSHVQGWRVQLCGFLMKRDVQFFVVGKVQQAGPRSGVISSDLDQRWSQQPLWYFTSYFTSFAWLYLSEGKSWKMRRRSSRGSQAVVLLKAHLDYYLCTCAWQHCPRCGLLYRASNCLHTFALIPCGWQNAWCKATILKP